MKKCKFSKVIAVALAALMVVGMVPMMALADDEGAGLYDKTVANADYTSVSHQFIDYDGNVNAYINYQYDDVTDGEYEAATGDSIVITMDGGTYTDTAAVDEIGWYVNSNTEVFTTSNDRATSRTAVDFMLSLENEDWTATLTDDNDQDAGTVTMTGYPVTTGANGNGLFAKSGSDLGATFILPNGLAKGTYTLTIDYIFHMKFSYQSFSTSYATLKYYKDDSKDASNVGDVNWTGTDTIIINVLEDGELDEPEQPEDEPEETIEIENTGDFVKNLTDNKVTIKNDGENTVTFGSEVELGYKIFGSGASMKTTIPLTADKDYDISFTYGGIEDGAVSVLEGSDVSFTISGLNDSTYTTSLELTVDDIIAIMQTIPDLATYATEDVINMVEGIDLPVPISNNGVFTITPTFTAYAVNVEDETDIYEFELAETADGYTFTASDIPAGDYSIVVDYSLEISFSYKIQEEGTLASIVTITVDADQTVEGARTIESSDTFVLTVNEIPTDHEHSYIPNVVDPTCTEQGYTKYVCELGDDSYIDEDSYTAALGHDWGEPVGTFTDSVLGVSCTVTRTCQRDDSHTESVRATVTSETKTAANCQTEGLAIDTATGTFSDGTPFEFTQERTISMTDHDYDYDGATFEWAEDYSTCTATSTCTVCGATTTNECTVSAVETTPATCEKAGEMTYTASFHIGGLDLGDYGVFGGDDYFGYETEVIPATGHDWDNGTVTKAPTYDEEGEMTYTCKNDPSHTYTETIDRLEAEEKVPQSSTEAANESGTITKSVYGYDVSFKGGADNEAVAEDVNVHLVVDLGVIFSMDEAFPIPEVPVTDTVDVNFDYSGVYVDGTFTADSGSDVTFGVTNFTSDYSAEIVIDYDLIVQMLYDNLGDEADTYMGLLSLAGIDEDFLLVVEEGGKDGQIFNYVANVTYTVTAVAEDGTVYTFDVDTDGSGNATFTCAGLPDGDYEVTVAYDIALGFDYNVNYDIYGIANITADGTVEAARTISSSDSFTLSVYEGGVMQDTGTSGGSTESGTEAGTETGTEAGTETGEGETETGETEHEHSYYIVDSAEATCEDEGWVLYACSECGEQFTQYTAALGHDFVDGVCTRCGAIDPDYDDDTTTAAAASSSTTAAASDDEDDDDEFTEAEDEDEFTEVEEDEFDVVSDESTTSPQTGASMAAIGAAMAFAAAGIVVVTRKKKEED